MIAFVFPGQGAQFSGMGQDLMDRFPKEVMLADRVMGHSMQALCSTDDITLRETQNTQPALFFINALHLRATQKMGLRPDIAAGHSLGELNALVAGGVFDLETGLRIAIERGRAMANATADVSFQGGMVAASNLTDHSGLSVLLDTEFADFDVATRNSPQQVVLSGPRERLEHLRDRIEDLKLARAAVLNVGCAFHSRYVQHATDDFRKWLEIAPFEITAPRIPVYSNVTADVYPDDRDSIIDLMVRQLVSPVLWMDSMRAIAATGPVLFHELGPRPVVTPLIGESIAPPMIAKEQV